MQTRGLEGYDNVPTGDGTYINPNLRKDSYFKVFPQYGVHLEGVRALQSETSSITGSIQPKDFRKNSQFERINEDLTTDNTMESLRKE